MRTTRNSLWRGSWMVLLPWLFLFAYWMSGTLVRYIDLAVDQMGDVNLGVLTLRDAGALEFAYRVRQVELDLERALGLLPRDALPRVQLFLAEGGLNRLNRDLPASGFDSVSGLLEYKGRTYKVDARYRGDFPVHWGFVKKSWRVKTRKKDLIEGRWRSMNLIRPKTAAQQSNFVGYEVARSIGLITPFTELVTLSINGRDAGLYLLVEQEDESTLRSQDLLPGDLYVGDQLFGINTWSGVYPAIFEHPGLWDKAAHDSSFDEERNAPLGDLLQAIRDADTPAGQARLEELVDFEAFARFNLLEVLLSSQHYDSQHNWKLYFDPGRGRFFPVVWDPLPWFSDWLPGGVRNTWFDDRSPPSFVVASPLMQALHRNAKFLRTRGRVFSRYLRGEEPDRVLHELAALRMRLEPVVRKDPALMSEGLRAISPGEALAAMERQQSVAHTVVARLRTLYGDPAPGEVTCRWSGEDEVLIGVASHAPLERLRLHLAHAPVHPPELSIAQHGIVQSRSLDGHAEWRDGTLELAAPLIADLDWYAPPRAYNDAVRVRQAVYRLRFAEPVAPAPIEVTTGGAFVSCTDDAALAFTPLMPTLMGVLDLPAPLAPLTWSGDIVIETTRSIAAPLTIRGGTRVRIAPGASLFLHNRVTIEGQDDPVTISGLTDEPWGAIIIEGPAANGTALRGFTLSGGSGLRTRNRLWSGMLSIHEVQDVSLSDCVVKNNRIMDDMVHFVYSSATIEDCRFENAAFDAVDVDVGTLRVANSTFTGSGNDGIDLMGSLAVVAGSRFTRSGDKGISVGERSDLFVHDSSFTENQVGVQTKDDSISVVAHNSFALNPVALDAYKKNWRYGTGGYVVDCANEWRDNGREHGTDRDSVIVADGCGMMAQQMETREALDAVRNQMKRLSRGRAR